jgi:hypothetical protein
MVGIEDRIWVVALRNGGLSSLNWARSPAPCSAFIRPDAIVLPRRQRGIPSAQATRDRTHRSRRTVPVPSQPDFRRVAANRTYESATENPVDWCSHELSLVDLDVATVHALDDAHRTRGLCSGHRSRRLANPSAPVRLVAPPATGARTEYETSVRALLRLLRQVAEGNLTPRLSQNRLRGISHNGFGGRAGETHSM